MLLWCRMCFSIAAKLFGRALLSKRKGIEGTTRSRSEISEMLTRNGDKQRLRRHGNSTTSVNSSDPAVKRSASFRRTQRWSHSQLLLHLASATFETTPFVQRVYKRHVRNCKLSKRGEETARSRNHSRRGQHERISRGIHHGGGEQRDVLTYTVLGQASKRQFESVEDAEDRKA